MNKYQESLSYIIDKYIDMHYEGKPMNEDTEHALRLQELVNKAKSFEWIPVSERLPEPSLNSVLGWDAYRERCCFVQYYNNEWILGNHESVKIVAWMALPKPYKEKEND